MKKQFTTILMVALCGLFMITSSLRAQDSEPATSQGCGGYTLTQGAYGSGRGAGANALANFSGRVTIGCSSGYTLTLTSVSAIVGFLPSGSTASTLTQNYVDPGSSYSNVLAGQLVALSLNVQLFGIGNQVITSGPHSGMTVSQFLLAANDAIGGCSTGDLSAINSTATSINENYDNGTENHGFLTCCTGTLAASANAGSIACFGGSTTITVSAGGGIVPYSGTGSFSVVAGTYTYNVTDAIGCKASVTVTVNEPAELVASSSATLILCHGGTAEVTVSATGGTGSYNGAGTFTVTAGTYSYSVTDANGCSSTTSITVTEPAELSVSSNISQAILCNGGDATVEVSASGGTGAYTGTGSFVVKAGTHTFTVTDENGCTATTSITVTEPTLLTAASVSGSIACFGGSTTVTVSGDGGTAPYSGTGDFTVNAGTYTYTVTDANGCTATTSITVTEPTQLTADSSSGSIACFGGSTTVTVSASGGTAPYSGTGDFTVTAGSYTYTVTDANGCATTTSITVSQPTLLVAASSASSILCYGGSSTVTVSASGGTAPYTGTGSWSVTAGTYTYTVTDANGCSATTSVTVSQPALLTATASSTQVTGYQCQDGTITVSASGGTTPYSYSLDGGAKQSNNMFAGLAAGNHTVMVTDANGCSATVMTVITNMSCDGKTTVTQGGWGAKPSGGNWGAYLVANWSSKIGVGGTLVIGSNGRTITLTSAKAVEDFLPSSGTPRALNSGNMINPTEKSYGNTLAGQTMAALINVKMFGIGNLVINSGSYAGQSVSQMIAAANIALGGGAGNASALTDALDKINRNYDNGTVNLGFLSCPCRGTTTSGRDVAEANTSSNFEEANITVSSYPNPFKGTTTIEFYVAKTGHVTLNVFSTNLSATHNLFNGVAEGERTYSVEFTTSNPGMYIYKLSTGNTVKVGKMIAQ